ncbi:uncharacterized protein LOC124167927 [Ischnura elegans]|uniref:uncharacterized protein LOC124167927 n=1 Tax=Ischnura elegans TaxID=197161 RepID=UPI001ED8A29A|nr:uncharacterized protein LOC124167927 [Ischnura elegans]
MTMASRTLFLFACVLVLAVVGVKGHGYMADPCQRSSLWRLGAPTPINWEDDELNCGGYGTQWDTNGGKCGECGDAYNLKRPRPNENGGKYGTGYIAKTYKQGEMITIKINITTSHMGYFEYRLCPMDGVDGKPGAPVPQSCLDKHLLKLDDGTTRWTLKSPEGASGQYQMKVQLPPGITCKNCVLQWFWRTANSWGTCDDGSEAMGCGPQETWSNCADITIE